MEFIELKKIENLLDGLSSRGKITKDRICKLEDRTIKISHSEHQREHRWK